MLLDEVLMKPYMLPFLLVVDALLVILMMSLGVCVLFCSCQRRCVTGRGGQPVAHDARIL